MTTQLRASDEATAGANNTPSCALGDPRSDPGSLAAAATSRVNDVVLGAAAGPNWNKQLHLNLGSAATAADLAKTHLTDHVGAGTGDEVHVALFPAMGAVTHGLTDAWPH